MCAAKIANKINANTSMLTFKNIVKRHFYVRDKLCEFVQNRLLDKFMCSSILCIVTYGVIKIYAVQIYATNA